MVWNYGLIPNGNKANTYTIADSLSARQYLKHLGVIFHESITYFISKMFRGVLVFMSPHCVNQFSSS